MDHLVAPVFDLFLVAAEHVGLALDDAVSHERGDGKLRMVRDEIFVQDGVAIADGALALRQGGDGRKVTGIGAAHPDGIGVAQPPGAEPDAGGDVEEDLGLLGAQLFKHADEGAGGGFVGIDASGVAVVRFIAAEGDAIELEIIDAVFLLVLQHGVAEQAAVILAGDAEVAAVGSDLHAGGFACGDADLALVVAADGAEPDTEFAIDGIERGGEIAEGVGEALLVDDPELVHVVPAIVEHEGIEVQAVLREQQFLKIGDARDGVAAIHLEARVVIPGVVEQERADRRDAHAGHVIEKLAMDQIGGSDTHNGGLAGVAGIGDIDAGITAESDFGAGDGVLAGGEFQAEEEIFGKERLAESAQGKARHAPFVLGDG